MQARTAARHFGHLGSTRLQYRAPGEEMFAVLVRLGTRLHQKKEEKGPVQELSFPSESSFFSHLPHSMSTSRVWGGRVSSCSGPLPPPCVHTGDGRGEGMLGKCPLVDAPGIPAESQPSLFPSFPGRDADRRKKTGWRRWIVIKEDLVAEEDEAVKDVVSSLSKGPYLLQWMVSEETQQWLGSNGFLRLVNKIF